MKTCFKCGQTKPISEFYRHPQMSDGHLGKCKVCTRADVKKQRDDLPPEIRRQKNIARNSGYKQRYPEKRRAHIATGNAIRDGRLQRQPCEVCGSVVNVQAHHEDYSQPLNVRWLCTRHHGEYHESIRA